MITKQKTIIAVLFLLMFLSILPPEKALAHDAYFLRVLVNESTMLYEGRVEFDQESRMSSELKHAEHELGNFQAMRNGSVVSINSIDAYSDSNRSASANMIFAFPSKEVGGLFSRGDKNHATAEDRERAYAISNALVSSLNEMLLTMNEGARYSSKDSFREATDAIIQASNGSVAAFNGWTLTPSTSRNVITLTKSGQATRAYPYRMAKGYSHERLEDGSASPIYTSTLSGDTRHITVGMLAAQGYYSMTVMGVTVANASEVRKPGILERSLSELLMGTVDGIRSALGLYSIEELVFNKGPRMQHGFFQGIMRSGWMEISVAFHMIFQAIAWSLLVLALLKALLEKNLSTLSIFKQISMMNSVKNILVTGFLLIASFLLLRTLITLNHRIVGIFETTSPSFARFGAGGGDVASMSDALLSLYYFIIAVYLNFVYILRGITVAVLVASAPLFIVSIAFSPRGSELFSKWSRELIANIFLQSFHAFLLGMLLTMQLGATGIEMAVIALALIPLTKFFKGLIVGEAGGLSGELAGGAVAAGAGFAAGAFSGRGKGRGGMGKDGRMESDIPGTGMHSERKEHSADTPSLKDSGGTFAQSPEGAGAMSADGGGEFSNRLSAHEHTNKDNLKGRAWEGAKLAGKMASGAALVTGGAVAGAALFSVGGPGATKAATGMVGAGMGMAGEGISGAYKGTVAGGKEAIDRLRGDSGGTIMGAEKLSDGSVAIHRNAEQMRAQGIEDAYSTKKEIGITYNQNLSNEGKSALSSIRALPREDWEARGIENVVENGNGTTSVFFNNYGKNQLGFGDVYKAGNRIVETKRHRDRPESRYIYDPKDITAEVRDKR